MRARPAIVLAITALITAIPASGLADADPALAYSPRTEQPAPTVTVQNCGGGWTHTLIVPAPSFDPLAATPAELEENGYPPRPPDPYSDDFTVWLNYVTHPIYRIPLCSGFQAVHPGDPGWVNRGGKDYDQASAAADLRSRGTTELGP